MTYEDSGMSISISESSETELDSLWVLEKFWKLTS